VIRLRYQPISTALFTASTTTTTTTTATTATTADVNPVIN
jgi:hypothetical protein